MILQSRESENPSPKRLPWRQALLWSFGIDEQVHLWTTASTTISLRGKRKSPRRISRSSSRPLETLCEIAWYPKFLQKIRSIQLWTWCQVCYSNFKMHLSEEKLKHMHQREHGSLMIFIEVYVFHIWAFTRRDSKRVFRSAREFFD